MKIVDLFCGTGGWVSAFPEGEYEIYGYDIEDFREEYPGNFVRCDLMTCNSFPKDVLLVVASPPCTDFSKASMPSSWKSIAKHPDIPNGISLFRRAVEIINDIRPRYWIIENVRGAQKFVGKASYRIGSRYMWTNVPYFYTGDYSDVYGKTVLPPGPLRPVLRSRIPYSISESLYLFLKTNVPSVDCNRLKHIDSQAEDG
ncbi:MAG: DNA cytosine methyltransferase [Candidatus Parvarchaeota archaeon]